MNDPNLYTKTPIEIYLGRTVRIRMDADFEIDNGPGGTEAMEGWRGNTAMVIGIADHWNHLEHYKNQTWVFLKNDTEHLLWDVRWLELLEEDRG